MQTDLETEDFRDNAADYRADETLRDPGAIVDLLRDELVPHAVVAAFIAKSVTCSPLNQAEWRDRNAAFYALHNAVHAHYVATMTGADIAAVVARMHAAADVASADAA